MAKINYGNTIHFQFKEVKPYSLNPQFSLCDILICYSGVNRNKTLISKQVLENGLYTLVGVPIVGEWVYSKTKGEKTWGGHGIEISENGLGYTQFLKAIGFVPSNAVESAKWVEITENDGITKHEYLKLEGCVLWTEFIQEAKSILEKNYGQSMVVEFPKGHYRADGVYVAEEIIFSMLCVLGEDHTPCFESSQIGLNVYKNLAQMIDAYSVGVNSNGKKGADSNVDKTIPNALKERTFKNLLGRQENKYILLATRDKEVDVIDREEDYTAYTIPYVLVDEQVKFEYDKKIPRSIGAVEKAEEEFDLKKEIETSSSTKAELAMHSYESQAVEDLSGKLDKIVQEYNELKQKYNVTKADLDKYVKAENAQKEAEHKKSIDRKIEEYAQKMSDFSEFSIYRSKVDYTKPVEQIEVDLLLLFGKYNKEKCVNKYSLDPVSFSAENPENSGFGCCNSTSRYGNLFDNIAI